MIKKYNLALTLLNQNELVIDLAHQLSSIAGQYKLGAHSSPHVTLYPFLVDEKQIELIWKQVCTVWQEPVVTLTFKQVSCLTFDDVTYWISLLPDQREVLNRMHRLLSEAVSVPQKRAFDPHMTLISTQNKNYEQEVEKLVSTYQGTPFSGEFVLSLGESDSVGQLVKILHRYEMQSGLTKRARP